MIIYISKWKDKPNKSAYHDFFHLAVFYPPMLRWTSSDSCCTFDGNGNIFWEQYDFHIILFCEKNCIVYKNHIYFNRVYHKIELIRNSFLRGRKDYGEFLYFYSYLTA